MLLQSGGQAQQSSHDAGAVQGSQACKAARTSIVLAAILLVGCASEFHADAARPYEVSAVADHAVIVNSATMVLYNVDGRRIPGGVEANSIMSRFGEASYEEFRGRQNVVDAGPHCLLFQSTYNNEFIQVPFDLKPRTAYQVIKYSIPAYGYGVLNLYADLFISPGLGSFANSRGFFSIFDTSKVEISAFDAVGDATGDFDIRFDDDDDEAIFTSVFDTSELTAYLHWGLYQVGDIEGSVMFANFAQSGFPLLKQNTSDEVSRSCPPVRLMMAGDIDETLLTRLAYPPVIASQQKDPVDGTEGNSSATGDFSAAQPSNLSSGIPCYGQRKRNNCHNL